MEVAEMEKIRDDLVDAHGVLGPVIIALGEPQTHGLRQAVRRVRAVLKGHRQRLDGRIEEELAPLEQGAGD